MLTDPITGGVLATDTYQASAAIKRHLVARDQSCRTFGCTRPATGCDLDHTIPWSRGGPTSITNLAHLCRRDHLVKHAPGWRVEQHDGGVLDWQTPTGHRITTRPPSIGTIIDTRLAEALRRHATTRSQSTEHDRELAPPDDEPPF